MLPKFTEISIVIIDIIDFYTYPRYYWKDCSLVLLQIRGNVVVKLCLKQEYHVSLTFVHGPSFSYISLESILSYR